MAQRDIGEINAELADLMRTQLGVRAKTLATALHRAGRHLPKAERRAGRVLVEAEALAANPKLRRRLELDALTEAEARLRQYLLSIDRADRRRGYWISVLTPLAFNLIVLIFGTTAFLVWNGWL